ncbi:LRR 8 domain containing protein [Asbolus verrucosus]|uniref:LRR 8 domain containing protein n=1 Tax=Asbolus verrucosus TaxID=1661398 RepID=A0A482W0X9_ASBVE|nr:LRR 8 domain containing protein [Asbolus verrucosus]
MLLCWPQLSSCLVLLWLCSPSNALCPSICTCKVTEKGRRKVVCIEGGMVDPIPTTEMDAGMEILEISAPETNWNSLTITPIFQHFKKLEELHIKKSNIHQIGMHVFWGVPSLRLLDLTLNNISGVFDHNFRGLVNLVELNLDDNRIRSLQTGVFKHLTELRILTLQRNLLEELVPRLFLKLGKLHVLKLSGNKFEELNPEVFKDIPVSLTICIRPNPHASSTAPPPIQTQFIANLTFSKSIHILKQIGTCQEAT